MLAQNYFRDEPMASEQGMSGIDVKAITSELAEKLPLWIDKVYQFDSRTLAIRLNGENKARNLLLIETGRRAHLVKEAIRSMSNNGIAKETINKKIRYYRYQITGIYFKSYFQFC